MKTKNATAGNADALPLRLDRARWWALSEQPFYGQLAMGLADVIDASTKTAATDGKRILWNPEFCAGLSDEELRFVLLHETLHCAHLHLWRLPHDEKGNIAGDYAINETLGKVPGCSMPKGGLTCPDEFRTLAEEEIYARLPEPRKGKDGNGKPGDQEGPEGGKGTEPGKEGGYGSPSRWGDFEAPASDQSGKEGQGPKGGDRDDWQRRVIQADQNAKAGRGELPADMARELARIRATKIDWRQEMADFVRDAASARNDWSRSARRHAWQNVIYPRKRPDDIGLCVFARDTSGSISGDVCAAFSAQISAALADTGCRGLVIDCDATIQAEIELAPGDECPLTAKGGGGTDFRPVFERVKELAEAGERVAGVVYLTDLEGTFPDDSGDVATIWLSTAREGKSAPSGRTVRIEL